MNGILVKEHGKPLGNNFVSRYFSILGLLIAFTVAYNLAKSYNQDALGAGGDLSCKVSSLGAMATGPDGLLTAAGRFSRIILALIVSIISTGIFRRLAGNHA